MWYRLAQKSSDDWLTDQSKKYNNVDDLFDALSKQGKIVSHGSPNKPFDKFDYQFLGSNGTSEGKGFYFTNKADIAQGYMGEDGHIVEAYVDVRKPLSDKKKTINSSALAKFIQAIDPDGYGFLSNYGDVDYDGYGRVLNEAIGNLMRGNDNDVDLIHDVVNSLGGNPQEIYPILKQTLGYDGIITQSDWGNGQTITIAFSDDQIITKNKMSRYYSS